MVLEKALESFLDYKEIKPVNPEAEALILWPLMRRAYSLEETQILGKIEGRRRREQQRMRWLNNITDSMGMNLSKLQK